MPAQRPAPSLPQWSVGKRFYTQREGPTCRSSRVSSDHHSEIGHPVVLILLSRVSLQLQGQFVPSFFEASSQDCGSWWGAAVGRHSQDCGTWWGAAVSHHSQDCGSWWGAAVGRHVLNFPARRGFHSRQFTGCGSEYYLQPLFNDRIIFVWYPLTVFLCFCCSHFSD